MANTVLAWFNGIFTSGSKYTPRANSWAVVSLWRRWFEMKEMEETERREYIEQIIEEAMKDANARPIEDPLVMEQRQMFVREYYRRLVSTPPQSQPQLNLRIPVDGGDSVHIAQ